MRDIVVRELRFTASSSADRATGLLGWVACSVGSLRLDGLALRRTLDDRLTLSWPGRKDGSGRLHHHVRPISDHVRVEVERQVFRLLDREVESWS